MNPGQVYLFTHFIIDYYKEDMYLGENFIHVVIPHVNNIPHHPKGGYLYDGGVLLVNTSDLSIL